MAEQLNFNLGIDATPMIQGAAQATQALEQKFKQAGNNIRSELEKPITIQAEFNLTGDPKKKYDEMVGGVQKVKEEQRKLNKRTKAQSKLQDKVSTALKGTKAQKKAALKLVERLMLNTKLTKEEMALLAKAAKELKKSLPKDKDMPKPGGAKGLETSFTGAHIAANLVTQAINGAMRAVGSLARTGMEMQMLNLQMEAFAGGAQEAEAAMSQFAAIASRSPLDVMQVAEGGRIMMAYGVSTQEAVIATEQLAIAAAATGGQLNNMARNLGQIEAQGRAYTRDLTQFAIQGVPIWRELSAVTGASVAELKDMAKDGKISFNSVSAALGRLTEAGGEFAMTAERMQETFKGKLALIESQFQTTAGEITEAMADIDSALGTSGFVNKLVEGMKNAGKVAAAMAEGFQNASYEGGIIANNVGQVDQNLKAADASAATFLDRFLVDPMESLNIGAQKNTELMRTAAQRHRENNTELYGAKTAADQLNISMSALTTRLQEMAQNPVGRETVGDFRELATEIGSSQAAMQRLGREALDVFNITDEKIKQEIANREHLKEVAVQAIQDEKEAIASREQLERESYERQVQRINGRIEGSNKRIEAINKELDATRQLGPAGEKLEALRVRELQYTARTGKELEGHITKEERKKLRAQASLEQIQAQEKANELNKEKIQEENKIRELKKKLIAEEKKFMEDQAKLNERSNELIKAQNDSISVLNGEIQALVDILGGDLANNWSQVQGLIDSAQGETGELTTEQQIYNTTIEQAAKNYDLVIRKLDTIRKKILTMPKLKTSGGGGENKFAGGPVSGGSTYTVNELGKEAFLSASGKLSMINAPAFGDWKAPGAGTVIPAHLTKQLDIPTGGINVNRAAGSRASVGGVMSVIQAAGGDTFNNSVTIQAANPVQAANNVMVEMTRLRRRRFR